MTTLAEVPASAPPATASIALEQAVPMFLEYLRSYRAVWFLPSAALSLFSPSWSSMCR